MARDLRAATVDSSWLGTSPQDYGAVGDGVADDIKALERAVETAAGGSGLVILSRDYAISRPLTMPRGVRLNGPAGFKRATTTPWAVTNGVVRPHRGWSGDALLVYGGGDDDANPHGAVIDGISVVGRDFARDAYPDLVGICVVNTAMFGSATATSVSSTGPATPDGASRLSDRVLEVLMAQRFTTVFCRPATKACC
jgi:hypothetical protein